jgi:hypothetical protein
MWPAIKNKHGQRPSKALIAPDRKRCQAFPNIARWSPMSLGPMPTPQRCDNEPILIIVQNKPDTDGLIGSMSLCADCWKLFRQSNSAKIVTVIRKD